MRKFTATPQDVLERRKLATSFVACNTTNKQGSPFDKDDGTPSGLAFNRPDTKSKKRVCVCVCGGGGVLSVSGPIRKGGGGQGAERLARNFLATTPILVFIFETETEGGA